MFLPSNCLGFPVKMFPSSNSMRMRLWSSASDKNRPLKKNWSRLLGITAESIEKTHGRWEKKPSQFSTISMDYPQISRTTNVWTPQPDIPSFLRVWIFVRPFWVSHKGISLWICDLRVFIRLSSDGFPASGSPAWAMDRENLWRVPRSGQPSPLWHYHTFEKCQEKFLHLSVKSKRPLFSHKNNLGPTVFRGQRISTKPWEQHIA